MMRANELVQYHEFSYSRQLNLKFRLLYKDESYERYSVIGHQTINQALIPDGINVGEVFQVRNIDGSNSIAVWIGTLLDSLSILQLR